MRRESPGAWVLRRGVLAVLGLLWLLPVYLLLVNAFRPSTA